MRFKSMLPLLAAGAVLLGIAPGAQAVTTVAVDGQGPGSRVHIYGDNAANTFRVKWTTGQPRKLLVRDMAGGAVATSQYCQRQYFAGVAIQNGVECTPIAGSTHIEVVNVNMGGGNDTMEAPAAGLPKINEYGGPGNDTLIARPEGSFLDGQGDNDVMVGGASLDVFSDQSGNDVALTASNQDIFVFADGSPGDVIWCSHKANHIINADPGDIHLVGGFYSAQVGRCI